MHRMRTEIPEIPLYIPASDSWLSRSVIRGSAIVGKTWGTTEDEIHVYYEGNKYGAANVVTLADRAMFAYWRMRDTYPTVAMAVVPVGELVKVGTLVPTHGVISVSDPASAKLLAAWIGDVDADELTRQCSVRGVRL